MKKVAVTGAAGQINYSLLFRIANGDLLGKDVPICLHLIEVPEALEALKGVVMELNDCCFPLLREIKIGSDPYEMFEDVGYAILVGAKARSKGMERKDLLMENAKIFVDEGKAINAKAAKDIKVLVIGNPCNTNALICMHNAPDIDSRQFFAMTRLDENRAKGMLALKHGVESYRVKKMAVWGNHSATQVPDYFNATINGMSAVDLIDNDWLEKTFVPKVQNRGAEIIEARGRSSAASAANAGIDSVVSLLKTTPEDDWYSICQHTKNNPYGLDEDLVFSFPTKTMTDGSLQIVEGIEWNTLLQEKISITQEELIKERDMVAKFL